MNGESVHLTRKGYEELCEKLEFLKTVRRREISKEIGAAIAQGDISENAEYDSAKDAQAFNEERIVELEDKLSRSQIIDDQDIPKDKAYVGATITLKDLSSGEEIQYTLLSELEADYEQGKISVTSPVGRALLGHKENDIIEIQIPAGALKYKILKISR